ncbi:MAG: HNH endonuclease, partial [Labilithrix sp.]|nr:HNH endonuclease [Labilithrix sp.]
FVSADGERCPAREWLEVDHRQPRALGGAGTIENVRILCRAHNRLAAEQAFGVEHVARKIEEARAARAAAEPSAPPNLIGRPASTTSPHSPTSTPPATQAVARGPVAANTGVATLAHDVDASVGSAASAAANAGVASATDASVVGSATLVAANAGVASATDASVVGSATLVAGGGDGPGDDKVDPRRRGSLGAFAPVPHDDRTPREVVRFALVRLGFRDRDVGTALARLPSTVWSEPLDVAVRAALRLLT